MASEEVFEDCCSSADELYEDCPSGADLAAERCASRPPAAPVGSRVSAPVDSGVSAPLDKRVTSPGGAAEEAAVLVTADGASVDEVRDSSASEGERDAGDRSAHGDWHVLKNTTPPGDAASSDEGDASESDSASRLAAGDWHVLAPGAGAASPPAGDARSPRTADSAADLSVCSGSAQKRAADGDVTRESDGDDEAELLPDPDAVDEEALRLLDESQPAAEREARRARAADLKAEGNRLYAAEGYDAARERYTAALRLCPLAACRERAVLFSNRAACRARAADEAGAIADCSRALELDAEYARPLQRRAELRERSEKLDEALEDWKRLLTLQPGHAEARRATARLPAQIAERNERLKDEMLGKLKDLGNMLLRPFNLSTNNFQMEENEAGGYSVKFNPT
ncbi:tetratricopeptide repeat protein 1-like [Pollicipes pollicipes]|uniref:tetratricopeptide repeat protein 1-like n=1 Tax=Pollicipes pollicipes TaxID=41117 RepID=UPI0018856F1A|nr:tetratricopeptide repeat protein 1-like [Pollicipes pollicipes]XP_037085956.1 tetratricopeptide repeat protein 1-like [Pollicipes pollicipes]